MAFSPLISYGTKVRTGALVSKRPCEPCQISIPAPLLAAWNGNGMLRRLEENSSLERPAIEHLAIDVLQLGDGLHALAVLRAG